MQPGGHRFDPGQLHQLTRVVRQTDTDGIVGEKAIMESIIGLGPLLVPISGIVMGGIIAIVVLLLRHQERIAKIERGIDPDAPRRG